MSDFDQELYEAVMAEMPFFLPTDFERARGVWMDAASIAARISAECQPVSDDTELGKIAYYAAAPVYTSEGYDDPDWDRLPEADPLSQEAHIRAAQAVRAAIAPPPLQVIPEWVTAVHIDLLGDDSFNFEGGWTEYGTVQSGDGDTLADALRAAIAQIREENEE